MIEPKTIFRSATGVTDFLHTVSVAAPLFLILVGSYILYENLIANLAVRIAVLLGLLAAIAALAPLGSRLKHVEITEQCCRVLPSHTSPYEIRFNDIEDVSVNSLLGVFKLKIADSADVPRGSIWFIPQVTRGAHREKVIEEVRTLLAQRIENV